MALDVKYLLLLPLAASLYTWLDIYVISKGIKVAPAKVKKSKPNVDKKSMPKTQQEIALNGLIALSIGLVVFLKSNDWFSCTPSNGDLKHAGCYALRWLCLPIATLFFAVINVANRRFLDNEAIDGTRTEKMNIHQRYLANTLEQTVLFSLLHLVIALSWSDASEFSNVPYIASNCCLFTCGRILFYRYTVWPHIPGKRALGFALTVQPSIIALVWCIFKLITSL